MCQCSLSEEPVVELGCGHSFHLDCALEMLKLPSEVTSSFLMCPLCKAPMEATQPRMRAKIKSSREWLGLAHKWARQRLKLDGHARDPALKPGGEFVGRLVEYAMTLYSFYQCSQCTSPYFGGYRACGMDADQAPGDRLCGPCAATKFGAICGRGHGDKSIEWKCRYCCRVAVWFCFGNTHMCEPCHSSLQRQPRPWLVQECGGPGKCAFNGKHAPNGEEFCLGCGECRAGAPPGSTWV